MAKAHKVLLAGEMSAPRLKFQRLAMSGKPCFISQEVGIRADVNANLYERLASHNIYLLRDTPVTYETLQNPETGKVTFKAISGIHPSI